MRVNIKLDIKKKYAFLIVGVLLILGGIFATYAFNANGHGGNPAIMGHSADELQITLPNGTATDLQSAIDHGLLINAPGSAPLELYFGGMYNINVSTYTNPLAGNSMGCPFGYNAYQILGSFIDDNLFLCVGDPAKVSKLVEFGGIYSDDYANPITGAKSCPSGYSTKKVLGGQSAGGHYPYFVDRNLSFCYTFDLSNPVIRKFGGMYGFVPSYDSCAFYYNGVCQVKVNELTGLYYNPLVGGEGCRVDYADRVVFGGDPVTGALGGLGGGPDSASYAADYPLHMCISSEGVVVNVTLCSGDEWQCASVVGQTREIYAMDSGTALSNARRICTQFGDNYVSYTTTTHGTSCGNQYDMASWNGNSWNWINVDCGTQVTVINGVKCSTTY